MQTNPSTEELIRLYELPLSFSGVAERVGFSNGAVVRSRLVTAGYKTRSRAEGQRILQASKRQKITNEELEGCRLDPAYEARHGIGDSIICRLCGILAKTQLTNQNHGHFVAHHPGMTGGEYQRKFPGAWLNSAASISRYWKTNAESNSGIRPKTMEEVMADRAALYVTADELRECRDNVNWEKERNIHDFVVCRKCGRKVTDRGLGAHAKKVHGYNRIGYYLAEFHDAPTVVPKHAEKQKRAHAEMRAALRKAQPKITKIKSKGGRPSGMEPETLEDARQLVKLMREFEKSKGTRRGALQYAARRVYGSTVDSARARDRASKTLTKFKKIIGTKPA